MFSIGTYLFETGDPVVPTPMPISDILENSTATLQAILKTVGDVVTTVTSNPLLLTFTCISIGMLGISVFNRLRS